MDRLRRFRVRQWRSRLFRNRWRIRLSRLCRVSDLTRLAEALHEHGDKSDLMESRAAFAEKRKPNFKGWLDPEDRYRMPTLDSVKE